MDEEFTDEECKDYIMAEEDVSQTISEIDVDPEHKSCRRQHPFLLQGTYAEINRHCTRQTSNLPLSILSKAGKIKSYFSDHAY
ncbi:unnamed protein product [Cylicostephanus goldi]|uniref:Uncharacterized protein n=1 Tax=Cylicostephanus goldi TaxID=71465 RepID=A0A3P6RY00_CYLGO|nr:unnamed protein product [Cylicostephanus goldi]